MVNFIEAYQVGLNAANSAEKNEQEIDAVFEEMNRQLFSATEGKISVLRQTIHENESSIFYRNLIARHGRSVTLPHYKPYRAIVARNLLVNNNTKELAKWHQKPEGYPCEITFGSKTMICEDKEALENALAEMLRDPIVGETLFKLTNLPIPEQTENSASSLPDALETNDN